MLDLLVHLAALKERLGGFEKAENEYVTAIVANGQDGLAPAGAVVRCHVAERGRNVFHSVQPEALDERDGGGGEEVEAPLARCHYEGVCIVHLDTIRDVAAQVVLLLLLDIEMDQKEEKYK